MDSEGKILIIEDDKSIAMLERDYLEANGFEVFIAPDGTQGLHFLDEQGFSLVILDLMLPGIDGFELCRRIRKEQEIPIIIVSAKREDIDQIRGLGLGADDYVTKPFSPQQLVARVKAHIARYARLTAVNTRTGMLSEITIREIKIDCAARKVWCRGTEVVLTNKEFELLVFLVNNPDIVFSKSDLFDKLWGENSFGETSTVTVHINRIRDKIELDTTSPQYIETVWGVGYRFRGKA
ncbi:MAG: response regulator transcription factor [Oscillospiraceae bacterium]|jgi:DNA-binding response OmpR family regulator|nr:response regulator transcription factor [Oscillospiraceae bacterium]